MKSKEEAVHYDLEIKGRVQGVGFRHNTVKQAEKLNLIGFVKNLASGNVYIEIEGAEPAVLQMIRWCHSGPSGARVSEINEYKGELKNYDSFRIRY